jgi:hypothetical protein
LKVAVPEEDLDGADVGAGLEEVAGVDHHEDILMGRRKVVDDPDFW